MPAHALLPRCYTFSFAALALLMGLLGGCAPSPDAPLGSRVETIREGSLVPPSQLGLTAVEQNAVLAQTVVSGTKRYQGCSATLIGDRVVVTAAHCQVLNQEEWLVQGKAPEVASVAPLRYVVGDDINAPRCDLRVSAVTIHPQAKLNRSYPSKLMSSVIEHDIAIALLEESVLERCKHVLPIGIVDSLEAGDVVDQKLLIGGFGSTDGSFDFSPLRYWGQMQGVELDAQAVIMANIKAGNVSKGDSGTGLLARRADGRLYSYGVGSTQGPNGGYTAFQRVDINLDFIGGVATREHFCGPAANAGVCIDGRAINCSSAGRPLIDDCVALDQGCVVKGRAASCQRASGGGDGAAGADGGASGADIGAPGAGGPGGCVVADGGGSSDSSRLAWPLALLLVVLVTGRRR
jgi:hypothetical protein